MPQCWPSLWSPGGSIRTGVQRSPSGGNANSRFPSRGPPEHARLSVSRCPVSSFAAQVRVGVAPGSRGRSAFRRKLWQRSWAATVRSRPTLRGGSAILLGRVHNSGSTCRSIRSHVESRPTERRTRIPPGQRIRGCGARAGAFADRMIVLRPCQRPHRHRGVIGGASRLQEPGKASMCGLLDDLSCDGQQEFSRL